MPFEFGGGGSSAPTKTRSSGDSSLFGTSSNGTGTSDVTPTTGFTDVPTLGDESLFASDPFGGNADSHGFGQTWADAHSSSRHRSHTPMAASSGSFSMRDLPWAAMVSVLGVLAVIVFLYVNRDAISSFVSQVLTWVLGLFMVYVVLRIVFRRRR